MTNKFAVQGMSCAACSASVEKAVSRLNGVESANVNLLGKSMLCTYDTEKVSSADIINAVKKAGFDASLYKEIRSDAPKVQVIQETPVKTRLIVSVAFLLPLMYISMGRMLGLPQPELLSGTENAVIYSFLQLLLALPVMYVNRKFYKTGFKALWNRVPNMDSLIAVGSGAAILYGIFSIFMIGWGLGHGKPEVAERYSGLYFESAAMILTLVTVGKLLEERSKGKTTEAISALVRLAPKTATVIRGEVQESISVDDITVGDILFIKPGERIPVDGTVVKGFSAVDESALTGESIPVEKPEGSKVLSASVNGSGSFTMRADKVGKDTTLNRIIELVEDAGAAKAPVARMADKVAAVFVPTVMCIAAATGAVWLIAGKSFEFALSAAISVLVISCPCALGLATPVAVTAATGRCASKGIMIKSAEAIETLCKCDTVVLDKTGTVTEGRPSVTDITGDRELLVNIAAALEKSSEHPLADAICALPHQELPVSGFTAVPGKGVKADVDGKVCIGGNARFMQENGIEYDGRMADKFASEGKTVMHFACAGRYLGAIAAFDKPLDTSAEAVKHLHSLKIKTVLLTGDNELCANAVAKQVGISRVIANVLPENKQDVIAELQAAGAKVIMVGDGINDAPALMRADVGVAVGSGTDIAMKSADAVLMKNDLRGVAEVIEFSGKTLRNIKQNLFWAFFYNLIGIPIAAGVLYPVWGIMLSPMIGAAAMSLSSVFVVTNALRLYKK